jgi:hypothetical protein
MKPDERQLHLLFHALGIQKRGKKWTPPYRNHFVAGDDDVKDWDALVAKGDAWLGRRSGDSLSGGMPLYHVTEQGKARATDALSALRDEGKRDDHR